ncbi:MAG TPA: methyl-accepting chemotaxis protein [Usitatibacteraceae bacterium]|nr:methyl-accepting chemotaxis protein [Usitatibacteraceae bacterium]
MTPRDFKIGTRLGGAFGAILVILVVVSVAGVFLFRKSREDLSAVMIAAGEKARLAADMKALVLEQSAVLRNIGLHSEIKAMQAEEDRARSIARAYDGVREHMFKLASRADEKAILDRLATLDKDIEAPVRQAIGLSTTFRNDEAAKVLLTELDPIVAKTLATLQELIELQKKSNEQAVAQAAANGERLSLLVALANALLVAMVLFVAWRITRSITVPIGESVAVAKRVAAGDLTGEIRVNGKDEAAELLRALADMNGRLGAMVQAIRDGAQAIATAAGQVAAGNLQLSSRTEDHASSLEETASTLEEFTGTVRQNADSSKQASELTAVAAATARRGGESVAKVVSTMQEVSTSSKRISDIINVIDGISFQTNILALNAAVEAARAGDQGRGFAVVAAEVRTLAQRSAASAKEIRALIADSLSRVETGTQLVDEAGRTMDEVVKSVQKVAEIMPQIAIASQEQSTGIDQINKAIAQMDSMVQMNASLVEEASAAAASMTEEANNLVLSVSQFRVAGGESAAPVFAASPAIAAARAPQAALRAPKAGRAIAPRSLNELVDSSEADDWKEF